MQLPSLAPTGLGLVPLLQRVIEMQYVQVLLHLDSEVFATI